MEEEPITRDQEPQEKKHKVISSVALVILALIVAALIGYIVYNSSSTKVFTESSPQPTQEQQQAQIEDFVQVAQQNAQEQQEAIAAAEQELSEKEAILANGIAELESQSCENALATAKTQKAILTKEIDDITTIGSKIENNPTFAIDVCRQLNPGLSKPECEARIATKAGEAQASIIEMEAMVEELDERIATDCPQSQESEEQGQSTDTQTPSE